MCGILGIYNFSKIENYDQRLNKGLSLLKHRGPDVQKSWKNDKVLLGHARLSIIDLNERSNQPIISEDGRYSMVFNGEIFNYGELKNELLQHGFVFKTASDTEVLFYGLQKFGKEFVLRLNGFFAFAFYDQLKDEFLLVRDRMGIKPLMYFEIDDCLAFGSELKSLISLKENNEINSVALGQLFQYTYVPAPNTIIKNVFKLEPGTMLIRSKGASCIERYFEVSNSEQIALSYKEACEKVRFEMENAVANRMMADVPLGTFLSGGFDSSIITGLAKEFTNELNTFSVGFKDAQFFDESEIAKKTAKYFGTRHHAIAIPREVLANDIEDVINSFDEPFGDSSSIAVYFLARETKNHVTVALSGDGADELFAGYNKHKAIYKSLYGRNALLKMANPISKLVKPTNTSKAGNISRKIAKFNRLSNTETFFQYDYLASFNQPTTVNQLLLDDAAKWRKIVIENVNDFLLQDQKFVLPNDMLKKVDAMSMRHSLEVRTPFLDHHVVALANGLPENFKINNKDQKRILKDSFRDLLPSHLYGIPKKGFEVPLTLWLNDVISDQLNTTLFSEKYIKTQGLFNFEFIKKMKSAEFLRNSQNASLIWTLIVFQNWYDSNLGNA